MPETLTPDGCLPLLHRLQWWQHAELLPPKSSPCARVNVADLGPLQCGGPYSHDHPLRVAVGWSRRAVWSARRRCGNQLSDRCHGTAGPGYGATMDYRILHDGGLLWSQPATDSPNIEEPHHGSVGDPGPPHHGSSLLPNICFAFTCHGRASGSRFFPKPRPWPCHQLPAGGPPDGRRSLTGITPKPTATAL